MLAEVGLDVGLDLGREAFACSVTPGGVLGEQVVLVLLLAVRLDRDQEVVCGTRVEHNVQALGLAGQFTDDGACRGGAAGSSHFCVFSLTAVRYISNTPTCCMSSGAGGTIRDVPQPTPSMTPPATDLPRINFSQRTLANGLRVIVAPDHLAPVVAINLWYIVGSRHEQPGRTGFAHLFEHFMFQGSRHVTKAEHFSLVQAAGGVNNATT